MAEQPVLLDRKKVDAGTLPSVLAADDQPQILEALTLLLQPAGFHVDTVGSPEAALRALRNRPYDAVLMDLNYTRDTTSGHEGLELLRQVLEIDSQLPVIVMTAWASVDLAVEAMRRGARDFITKPWENARLVTVLQTQVTLYRALRRAQLLEAENQLLRATDRPEMIAESPAMQPVLDAMTRVGPSDANVLITGEHGTGKEIVAHTLHALSARADHPWIAVNTGALSEGVFESEVFGHVKGAFTDARPTALVALNWPIAEPYFWMKSPMFRSASRQNFCAFWRQENWSRSARRAFAGSMSGYSLQPTPI